MKRCLACGDLFDVQGWVCPHCGVSPEIINGFLSFAPQDAFINDGFEEHYFEQMFDLEANNFWFKGRARLVNMMLKKYIPVSGKLLEIGCGTGYMLSAIEEKYPQFNLSGSKIFAAGLGFTARRVHDATLFQMDARNIPFADEFDVIGAFDVIEHIEEDARVLSEMHRAMCIGGLILLTVPQHKWLWSYVDEYAHHKRRYSAKEIRAKVEAAGFRIIRITSFVSLLLPLMYLSRLRNKHARAGYDDTEELRIGGVINRTLGWIMSIERLLIAMHIPLIVGGSLLVVAEKI